MILQIEKRNREEEAYRESGSGSGSGSETKGEKSECFILIFISTSFEATLYTFFFLLSLGFVFASFSISTIFFVYDKQKCVLCGARALASEGSFCRWERNSILLIEFARTLFANFNNLLLN